MAYPSYSTRAPKFRYPWPSGRCALSRREAETMIEGLIAYLDQMDGDADYEPALGSIDAASHSDFIGQEDWAAGSGQDREAGDDNGLGDEDGMIWALGKIRQAA